MRSIVIIDKETVESLIQSLSLLNELNLDRYSSKIEIWSEKEVKAKNEYEKRNVLFNNEK